MQLFPPNPSIRRILLICMAVVAIVPVVLLTLHIYQAAWQNSAREIREKHQLLAENLTQPVSIYVNNHLEMLSYLAHTIEANIGKDQQKKLQQLLTDSARDFNGFQSIAYINTAGSLKAYTHKELTKKVKGLSYLNEGCYLKVKQSGRKFVSGVKASLYTGKPVLTIGQPVRLMGRLRGVLLAELRIDVIEALRKNVKFGDKGHAAIVDQNGRVIAHPNPAWMAEMKDLSSWPIIQNMMAGKTGVTEFYSSFIKENMVAGYSSVPEIGWGIMVPQPKSEVEAQVRQLMVSNYAWGLAGLIMAALLAMLMSSWISRSINQLAEQSKAIAREDCSGESRELDGFVPAELKQLSEALQHLVQGLSVSRDEVHELNKNLQVRVDDATDQLRQANKKLEKTAQSDYLTKIANRRYFEQQLSELLSRRSDDTDNVCIMLIDVDKFKEVNDKYGHQAGDVVLTHVARILETAMRPEDLVARYGGDEFVTRLRCSHDIAMERAHNLREQIEKNVIPWQGGSIRITASIGVYCQSITDDMDVESIMHHVDQAMYKSKRAGRNRVSELYNK